jgi:hypothetical protein
VQGGDADRPCWLPSKCGADKGREKQWAKWDETKGENAMSDVKFSRRDVVCRAGLAIAASALAGVVPTVATAAQGNMDAALRQLQNALDSLHQATPNKGGHKDRAAQLVEQAMAEVQAGIDYAAQHGGG